MGSDGLWDGCVSFGCERVGCGAWGKESRLRKKGILGLVRKGARERDVLLM